MGTLHPPEPKSERECLFEIYGAVVSIQKALETLCQQQTVQDKRLDRLERWRMQVLGAAAFALTALGYLAKSIVVSIGGGGSGPSGPQP